MFERCREEVPFHVMNADHRDAARERQRLGVAHAHEKGPDQPRRGCHRNRIDVIELGVRIRQRPLDHGNNAGEMGARRYFRNNSPKHPVYILGKNDE